MSETILIKTTEVTAALEATGTVTAMTVIKTGTAAQEATAMSILSGIDEKNWVASDTVEEVNGETSVKIRLPKEAIK